LRAQKNRRKQLWKRRNISSVGVIGAGLAGCEAAIVLARSGVSVTLYEMRPEKPTRAHATGLPAELVCSNSLKSQELPSAQALLKAELDILKSPLLDCARTAAVRAGSALAVDRLAFSTAVLAEIKKNPLIDVQIKELDGPPPGHDGIILATGPLSSDAITGWLTSAFPSSSCYFYDAIAPIVAAGSLDAAQIFFGNRWKPELDDYCNCPFTEEEYRRFYEALIAATTTPARDFEEERFFEACLPIEVIAHRGYQAMAFGPLKPVGFRDPETGRMPFAVLQLRRENSAGESYSMVACQTRLTIGEQQRVFRMIPGLENAEFLRLGSCHRNTYIDSPSLLAPDLSFKALPGIFCAGQLCGNEGYVESIATGHCAALFAQDKIRGYRLEPIPDTTALGSLVKYVTSSETKPFTPSSFHFGLLPGFGPQTRKKIPKKQKHELLCKRALEDLKNWARQPG
jgi:methylenetetrahydrofolate--tRNA-(uracil-5-)-methyltransferase